MFSRAEVNDWRLTKTLGQALIVYSAVAILILSARIVVPVPWGPVPITAQSFVLMLIAAFLGGTRAAAATSLYILHGLMGFPAFAWGGGPMYLSGPTGGYLLGFVLFAWIAGRYVERMERITPVRLAFLFTCAHVFIYAPGMVWLGHFIPWKTVPAAGLFPFIPGDMLKIVLASTIVTGILHTGSGDTSQHQQRN